MTPLSPFKAANRSYHFDLPLFCRMDLDTCSEGGTLSESPKVAFLLRNMKSGTKVSYLKHIFLQLKDCSFVLEGYFFAIEDICSVANHAKFVCESLGASQTCFACLRGFGWILTP